MSRERLLKGKLVTLRIEFQILQKSLDLDMLG